MEEREERQTGRIGSGLWEFVKVVALSLLIVLPIRAYVAQPFIVSGASMRPNFENGEYLIIDELSYLLREPERGEVIVFRYPLNPSEFFIKRVVGLPGETVSIKDKKIVIETESGVFDLAEPYLSDLVSTKPDGLVSLKENEYFVLGDNRSQSSDSRFWGTLDRDKIIGRAFLRLWPITKIRVLQ